MDTNTLAVFTSALLFAALVGQVVNYRRSLKASIRRLARMHRQVTWLSARHKGLGSADAQVHIWVAYVYLESAKTLDSIGDETAATAAAQSGYEELCQALKTLRSPVIEFLCFEFGAPHCL